jgi:hypothetical protein
MYMCYNKLAHQSPSTLPPRSYFPSLGLVFPSLHLSINAALSRGVVNGRYTCLSYIG